MSDVNPIRPNQTPMPNAGAAGAEGLRNQYDQRGGKGGGKGQGKEKEKPEPEPVAEEGAPEDEQGHLETDSFSGRKARNVINNLFADALPWEQEEADKAAKLEELKRKREALTNRGAAGPAPRAGTGALPRKPGAVPPPPGRPGTGGLGGVKIPAPPAEPVARSTGGGNAPEARDGREGPPPGVPLGRRVDENFDPTAALNSTLQAHQELRQRQAQREREEQERRAAEENALDAPGLAKFLRAGQASRSPSGPLPPAAGPADDGGMLTAPLRPEIEMVQPGEARGAAFDPAKRPAGQPAVRLPSIDDLAGQAPPAAPKAPTGKLPPRPVMPPRPGTGKLDPGAAPPPGANPPPAGPRQAPRPAAAPARQDPPAARADAAPKGRPAADRPAPTPPPAEPAAAPAPSWTAPAPPLDALEAVVPAADDLLVPFPTDEEPPAPIVEAAPPDPFGGAKPPPVKAGQVSAACVYRVIDVGTNKPMGGARVELEPTHDDLLPNLHGQANAEGWYTAEGLPPGEYRVTVRAPGYVPAFKVRLLEVGVVDDLAIFITKP